MVKKKTISKTLIGILSGIATIVGGAQINNLFNQTTNYMVYPYISLNNFLIWFEKSIGDFLGYSLGNINSIFLLGGIFVLGLLIGSNSNIKKWLRW